MNFNRDSQRASRFAQKRRFFALRFGQRDGNPLAAKRDGNSGKPGARTEVQERGNARRKSACACDRLDKVPAKDPLLVANRSEVDPLIPVNDEFEIICKARCNGRVKSRKTRFGQQSLQPQLDIYAHLRVPHSFIRFSSHALAACANEAKMARESRLAENVRSGCHCTPRTK